MVSSFDDHKYLLFLDRKLYLSTIQLQAKLGLGKSFSAMLPFVTGLHEMGFLCDADFEVYKAKYSIGLEEAVCVKSPAQIKKEETRHNKNRQLNNHFGEVLAQWSTLSEKTRAYHLKGAAKYPKLKIAKLVVELGEQDKERLTIED